MKIILGDYETEIILTTYIPNFFIWGTNNLFSTHELQIKTQNSIIDISVYSNIFSTFLGP